MSVTRDFDAMLAEKAGVRPTFKIAGQEFTLRAKLPYAKWQKLQHAMRSDDITSHEANQLFFGAVLARGDVDRFLNLLDTEDTDNDDDADLIGSDQLDALTEWALEHFTGKAPENANGSAPGSNATGESPNVRSLRSKRAANA